MSLATPAGGGGAEVWGALNEGSSAREGLGGQSFHEEVLDIRSQLPWHSGGREAGVALPRGKEHLCHVPIPSTSGTQPQHPAEGGQMGKHPRTGMSQPVFTSTKEQAGLLLFIFQ